jgi:hypothetical protein
MILMGEDQAVRHGTGWIYLAKSFTAKTSIGRARCPECGWSIL